MYVSSVTHINWQASFHFHWLWFLIAIVCWIWFCFIETSLYPLRLWNKYKNQHCLHTGLTCVGVGTRVMWHRSGPSTASKGGREKCEKIKGREIQRQIEWAIQRERKGERGGGYKKIERERERRCKERWRQRKEKKKSCVREIRELSRRGTERKRATEMNKKKNDFISCLITIQKDLVKWVCVSSYFAYIERISIYSLSSVSLARNWLLCVWILH